MNEQKKGHANANGNGQGDAECCVGVFVAAVDDGVLKMVVMFHVVAPLCC
jgi:hypothetical protein